MNDLIQELSIYAMVFLYMVMGILHLYIPKYFLRITPKWVPYPSLLNILVGILELVLAVGILFSQTRTMASYSIMILLAIVFPANVYHFQKALRKKRGITVTLMRLPLQLVLIYWAFKVSQMV